jgi:hypothetical protein
MTNKNSFVGAPPATAIEVSGMSGHSPVQQPRQAKQSNTRIYIIATMCLIAVILGSVVAVLYEQGVFENDSSGNTVGVTIAPATKVPTLSPTVHPTGSPTYTPSAAPTYTPTSAPSLPPADCTVFYGDMQDASSPFSFISQSKTSPGRLVTGVVDTSHTVSASSPTSVLGLNFKNSGGNPYGIGAVTGAVYVNSDGSTILSATLSDPNFYIYKMGGITSGSPLDPDILHPQESDVVLAFLGDEDTASTVNVYTPYQVIGFDSAGNFFECTSHSTPNAACAGPWYSYHYVEVCPKNVFATKAPTSATAPTPLATPAPTSSTPTIEVVFTKNTTDEIVTAFENAMDFWNSVIINTHETVALPSGTTHAGTLGCSATSVFPDGTTELTGLTIFATIGPIDGVGQILGRAGPCSFSYEGATSSAFGMMMSRIGEMTFDEVDLQSMVDDGTLERVIMHEMGHVLGIGTLWHNFRKGSAGDADNDPRYIGVKGNEGYKQIGGLRSDIPIANTGGGGTANGHWRESTFPDELMSGYASGAMPASIMTVKTLEDLGYTVDESKAEAYSMLASQTNDIKFANVRMLVDDIATFKQDTVMTFNP